jgi:hypothetical protein
MGFRRGAKAAEAADKRNNTGGGFGPRATYLQIDPGKSETLRFLWDYTEWLVIGEHSFIDTRDPHGAGLPEKVVEKWPKRTNATCRYDDAFLDDETGVRQYNDCYICDNLKTDKNRPQKPKVRIYSLVCLRDPVIGTQEMVDAGQIKDRQIGKTVGYEDRFKEVPKLDDDNKPIEGETRWVLDIQVACFGWNNFYQALQVLAEQYDDTVLDRDIRITRKGEKLETRYLPAAMEPQYFNGFDPDNPEEDRILDVRDEDVLAYYMDDVEFDIEAAIAERASDFHYARYFDVTQEIPLREWEKNQSDDGETKTQSGPPPGRRGPVTRPGGGRPGTSPTTPANSDDDESSQDSPSDASSEGSADADEARMQAMRARVRSGGRRETTDA